MLQVSVKLMIFTGTNCSASLKDSKFDCAGFKIHLPGFAPRPELPPCAWQLGRL